MIISCDVETRSSVDLKTRGAYNYFESPDADVLCLCYSVDGGPIQTWLPGDLPPECFATADRITAWNAAFERLAFSKVLTPKYGFPTIALETWYCTAYESRCSNMPTALGNAARCLGTAAQKDPIGERLIKQLCIPQPDGSFNNDPIALEQLAKYCAQDVLTEMAISRLLRPLSAEELADWHVGERMNDRGIRVDLDLCRAAVSYAKDEEDDLIGEIARVTDGAITKVRGERTKAWIVERLTEDQLRSITNGAKVSLDKRARESLLSEDLDADVRQVLEAMDAVGKSSVGKFKAMRNRASSDERVRGVMVTAGASQTGRASSMGIQIQNFPRETAKYPLEIRQDLLNDIHPEELTACHGGTVMSLLSSMLRPALLPADGCVFLDADYSSIENRVGPWLTASDSGKAKLQQFIDGLDPYLIAASDIYGAEVKEGDPRRQVGKVAELSLGYGGGKGAFGAMAANYGVVLHESEVKRTVDNWRGANSWAVNAWAELELAFVNALRNPETRCSYGRVTYMAAEDILSGGLTVFAELPCGRYLTYPDVKVEDVKTAFGTTQQITFTRANWTPKQGERQWPRAKTYGGSLFENVVQATAASLMRWALRQLDAEGANAVCAIHDQVLLEVPITEQEKWTEVLHRVMNSTPDWADGLPVAAEVDVRERFGK